MTRWRLSSLAEITSSRIILCPISNRSCPGISIMTLTDLLSSLISLPPKPHLVPGLPDYSMLGPVKSPSMRLFRLCHTAKGAWKSECSTGCILLPTPLWLSLILRTYRSGGLSTNRSPCRDGLHHLSGPFIRPLAEMKLTCCVTPLGLYKSQVTALPGWARLRHSSPLALFRNVGSNTLKLD